LIAASLFKLNQGNSLLTRTIAILPGIVILLTLNACQKNDGASERDIDMLLTHFASQVALAELCHEPEIIMFTNKLEQKIDASHFSEERKKQFKEVFEQKRQYSLKKSAGERSEIDCNILLQGYRNSKVWDDEWFF
jgi:hypothetical protein